MLFWHWHFKERKSVYLAFLRWEKYQWKYFQSMVKSGGRSSMLLKAITDKKGSFYNFYYVLRHSQKCIKSPKYVSRVVDHKKVSTYDQIRPKKGNILLSDCNLTCVDLHKWEKFFVRALFIILPHYNVTFLLDDFLTSSSFNQSWLTQLHKKILSRLQKSPFFGLQ